MGTLGSSPEGDQQAKIDEYGELDRQIQEFQPTVRRHKVLSDEIKSWLGDIPPEHETQLQGRKYTLQISAASIEREVIPHEAYRILRLKIADFLNLVTVPLKKVAHLDPAVLAKFVAEGRTGSRRIKAVAKAVLSAGA